MFCFRAVPNLSVSTAPSAGRHFELDGPLDISPVCDKAPLPHAYAHRDEGIVILRCGIRLSTPDWGEYANGRGPEMLNVPGSCPENTHSVLSRLPHKWLVDDGGVAPVQNSR